MASCWAPTAVNLLYWTLGRETHPGVRPLGPSSPRPRPPPHSQQSDLSPALPRMPAGTLSSPQAPGPCYPLLPRLPTYSSTRRDTICGSTCARFSAPVSQMQLLYRLPGNRGQGRGWRCRPRGICTQPHFIQGQTEAQRIEAASLWSQESG